MTTKTLRAIALLMAAALIGACSSADKAALIDSALAVDAMDVIREASSAYSAGRMDAFESYFTPEAFAAVEPGLRRFTSASLKIEPRWVELSPDDSIEVQAQWQGRWEYFDITQGRDAERTGRGVAVFTLAGTPPRITSVTRSLPFAEPDGAALLKGAAPTLRDPGLD
jgi:hypothetical protein